MIILAPAIPYPGPEVSTDQGRYCSITPHRWHSVLFLQMEQDRFAYNAPPSNNSDDSVQNRSTFDTQWTSPHGCTTHLVDDFTSLAHLRQQLLWQRCEMSQHRKTSFLSLTTIFTGHRQACVQAQAHTAIQHLVKSQPTSFNR